MKDDVEVLVAKLFRAPRGGQVTPQVVGARALRRLHPAGAFPAARALAARLARVRRGVCWQELDRLGKSVAREIDFSPARSAALEDVRGLVILSEALMWGWQRHATPPPDPREPLCSFCHRPAVRVVRSRTPVCVQHRPRTSGAQHAARLVRWAGSPARLHEMVLHQAAEIRASVPDTELEDVLRTVRIDQETRDWWSAHPDLELPIRFLAHRQVEAAWRQWVDGQRITGARGGARARAVPLARLAPAVKKVRGGMSVAGAARMHGVSEATLRRHLRRNPVPVL